MASPTTVADASPWNDLPLEVKQLIIEHYVRLLAGDARARDHHSRPFTDLIEVGHAFGQDICLVALRAARAKIARDAAQTYASSLGGSSETMDQCRDAQLRRTMCLNLISVVMVKLNRLAGNRERRELRKLEREQMQKSGQEFRQEEERISRTERAARKKAKRESRRTMLQETVEDTCHALEPEYSAAEDSG